jgi:hypothetical protein
MGTRQYEEVVDSDCKWWRAVSRRGWNEPGKWARGTYRVEILIDGVKFAEEPFTIE